MAWPEFIQFPADDKLRGRPTLIVDDVWGSGRTITAVKNRVSAAGGFPETCVLHFNPYRSLFGTVRPDYYAAITDAFILYPWEIDRGVDKLMLGGEPALAHARGHHPGRDRRPADDISSTVSVLPCSVFSTSIRVGKASLSSSRCEISRILAKSCRMTLMVSISRWMPWVSCEPKPSSITRV